MTNNVFILAFRRYIIHIPHIRYCIYRKIHVSSITKCCLKCVNIGMILKWKWLVKFRIIGNFLLQVLLDFYRTNIKGTYYQGSLFEISVHALSWLGFLQFPTLLEYGIILIQYYQQCAYDDLCVLCIEGWHGAFHPLASSKDNQLAWVEIQQHGRYIAIYIIVMVKLTDEIDLIHAMAMVINPRAKWK